ncbi:hypothetical protein Tco_0483680 [Tanacetum coccineum]
MSIMAENVIVTRAENRPPMLERIKNGLFKFGTVEVPVTPNTYASRRERTLTDLTLEEKIREACDIRATNIILQGLPPDVYTLMNHHTIAKEIRDRVKVLIEGSELSLQERESKLYNEFDRFTYENGETIHSYYIRFAKLINDMNTIGMIMQKLQSYTGNFAKGKATGIGVIKNTRNVTANKSRDIRCYNYKDIWEIFDSGPDVEALTTTAIFQTDDLDAFDSDCDEAPTASVVFMATLSVYDSYVLSEV